MRRLWRKRKARVNRKFRRKTEQVLKEAISAERADALKAGDDGTARELIRKGLTREKHLKWGVSTLQEALEAKIKSRMKKWETNGERKERNGQIYIDWILALERDPNSPPAKKLIRSLRWGDGHLWRFYEDYPGWKKRLWERIRQLQKAEQKAAERARIKAEQKRSLGNPRIPQKEEIV